MNVRQLQIAADQMRLDILDEITTAQSGHIGGALSICELLAVLYGEHMKNRHGRTATGWYYRKATHPPRCMRRWPRMGILTGRS